MTKRRAATRFDLWLVGAFYAAAILGGCCLIARYVIAPSLIPIAIILAPGGEHTKAKAPVTTIDVHSCFAPRVRADI
jgi:hypothetical protein